MVIRNCCRRPTVPSARTPEQLPITIYQLHAANIWIVASNNLSSRLISHRRRFRRGVNNAFHHGIRGDAFGLAFKVENNAVSEGGSEYGADVIKADIVPSVAQS